MNILISTTTNWNEGDDIIRFGVQNILKKIFHNTPNYIHYDRNPNNMIDYPHNQNMKEGLLGNFMNNPIDWGVIDLVVLAGSPEWLHHPLTPIYEGLSEHPNIPLWAIGVGYSEPEFLLELTEQEKRVLKRPSTLIISRQQELSDRIETLLKKVTYTLPCPALFCFDEFPEKTKKFIHCPAHDLNELYQYEQKTFFNSDPHSLLKYIGKHEKIVTTRLHGFIAAISSGASAKLISDNFRVKEASKLFNEVTESNPTTIKEFKEKTLTNYINIIKHFYDKAS